jgi:hypothetical protein
MRFSGEAAVGLTPADIAQDLRIQYATVLLDPDLNPRDAQEIARRTELALIDWMEDYPELQTPNGNGSRILDI